MFSFQIPLWLKLSDIQINLKLSVNEYTEEFQNPQQNIETAETFTYEIFAIGELSRLIEIISDHKIDNEKAGHAQFYEISVDLKATKDPAQKYRGQFFYLSNDETRRLESKEPRLSLCLYVPERPLIRFCDALISRKISSLLVGISVKARQDSHVGAFRPPNRDDVVYIEANDGLISCKVKLREIASITACQERKNDHIP